MESLRRVTGLILEPQRPAGSLRTEVLELAQLLAGAQTTGSGPAETIAHGETRTAQGLALSPTMATMCAADYVRTVQFLRGSHAAILELRKQFSTRPVRVLYAGCGPWATLAVPLMAVFTPAEATFTLLDIHPEAIESARSVVTNLGLAASVTDFKTLDATSYHPAPDLPPDVILVETMQAGLENEPQVAITRHLLKHAPQALLIPEEVRIDLMLVDPAREFHLSAPELPGEPLPRVRIPVAAVFVVNRETLKSWADTATDRLPAAVVQIPDSPGSRYQPLLFTTIRVYGNHKLQDYDSGLTCPRRPTIKGNIKSGDRIQFHYELGSRPGLRSEVVASESGAVR